MHQANVFNMLKASSRSSLCVFIVFFYLLSLLGYLICIFYVVFLHILTWLVSGKQVHEYDYQCVTLLCIGRYKQIGDA